MEAVNWQWPGGKKIAVVFYVAFEAWSDGKAPGISPMGNPLPAIPGIVDSMAVSWAAYGAKRGIYRLLETFARHNVRASVMTNAILAEQFLELFDGFSIGSNDMTQLTLGLDRDSGLVAEGFDERDEAVKAMLAMSIKACRKAGKYVGICGQGPSDHPDLARWLMEQGIESLSLNPDTVVSTWMALAEAPKSGKKSAAA